MKSMLKRYGMALGILLGIAFLMVIGTLGVKSLGTMMVEDSHGAINPNEVSRGLK